MGLFDRFKGKAKDATKAAVKLNNKDLVEALTGALALVVMADGSASDDEITKVKGLLRTNKNVADYASEVERMFDDFIVRLKAGFRTGRQEILREISQVKGNRFDAEAVLLNAIEVAEACGDEPTEANPNPELISPEEEKALAEIAKVLDLRLEDHL